MKLKNKFVKTFQSSKYLGKRNTVTILFLAICGLDKVLVTYRFFSRLDTMTVIYFKIKTFCGHQKMVWSTSHALEKKTWSSLKKVLSPANLIKIRNKTTLSHRYKSD